MIKQQNCYDNRDALLRLLGVILCVCSMNLKSESVPEGAEHVSEETGKGRESSAVELVPLEVQGEAMQGLSYNVPNASSATKTDTSIMEIPQSIQVLPESILVDQDLQTLSSAMENVSSVVAPKSTEILTSEFVIRGFKSRFYLDGMPAFGQANVTDPLSLVNVERVEVVKGPTATLFGGGLGAPIGGLINVVSKQPEAERKYVVSFRGGSYETLNPSFDFNQPLSSDDRLLFRLTGEYEQSESFIKELRNEQYSIFPTLSYDFSEDTRIVLRGQYSKIKFLEYSGLRAEGTIADAPYSIPRFRYSGATDTPDSTVENKMLTLEFSHRFSPHIQANISARYFENEFTEFSSFHHSVVGRGVPRPNDLRESELVFFSGKLGADVSEYVINPNFIFDFETGFAKHKVLLGGEYDNTQNAARIGTNPFNRSHDFFLDVADPNDDIAYIPIADGNFTQTQDNTYETKGVYLQDQLDIGDDFHLLASVRWTDITVKERNKTTQNDSVTPRVGAVYDLTDSISAFIGYGEGFQAVIAFFGDTSKPELSEQIEGGFKFDFYDIGLSGAIAGYELIRKNVVVPNPQGAFSSIQAGEQKALGAELDFLWEPTDSLSIIGNYAYTNAKLTAHPRANLVVGDKLPRVPEHSGRIAFRYRFEEGWLNGFSFGMGATLSSSRHIRLPNTFETKGFYRIDAQMAYAFTENIDLTVNIQNLTDYDYYEPFLFLEDSVVAPGQPLSAFATLRFSF